MAGSAYGCMSGAVHAASLSPRMGPMNPKSIAFAAIALAAGAIAPAAAQAPLHPALQDRWTFGAGVFFPSTATQASLTSNNTGLGTTVDFEDTLDMERSKA